MVIVVPQVGVARLPIIVPLVVVEVLLERTPLRLLGFVAGLAEAGIAQTQIIQPSFIIVLECLVCEVDEFEQFLDAFIALPPSLWSFRYRDGASWRACDTPL